MKEYIGNFPINKALTKKLNVRNWVVYRDNVEGGMYLLNTIVGEEIMTMYYNETAKGVSQRTLEEWRADIEDTQREWDEILADKDYPKRSERHSKYYEDLQREKASRD